jgi:hypothetical protein
MPAPEAVQQARLSVAVWSQDIGKHGHAEQRQDDTGSQQAERLFPDETPADFQKAPLHSVAPLPQPQMLSHHRVCLCHRVSPFCCAHTLVLCPAREGNSCY